jgi:glucose/arabinose dehydrogenase
MQGRAWLLLLVSLGCWRARGSEGGGQIKEPKEPRAAQSGNVHLPPGYRIEPVARGLTFPVGVAFDDAGEAYVAESGYVYGEKFVTPRLLHVDKAGATKVIATGDNGPWTGVVFHKGAFYVAEGGVKNGGKILRISKDGSIKAIVEGLPSLGDHHTNGPAIGPDGMLYFGQGTATNSGVVGDDNAQFGWLARHKDFHDIPCRDITLAGTNYESGDKTLTGAFVPYGTKTDKGQVISGKIPCSGAIMKVSPDGGTPELVAWGFRNPFGLAFSPDGKLYATENGFDIRGSRPVFGAADHLYEIKDGTWYGWPDYAGGESIASKRYAVPGKDPVALVLASVPNKPPPPVAFFGVHSSSNGLDFSRNAAFGYVGDAFVAQFGDMVPKTGKVVDPVGFKVVRVDVKKGVIYDFATNAGDKNGPASKLKHDGLERPVSCRFDPTGTALWVADFGIMTVSEKGPNAVEKSGVLWRITKS